MSSPPATCDSPALELHGVSIGYHGHAVVHDIDLCISRGEVVAVLGANGSGKSTLIRGVLGLAQRLSGDIKIFGRDGSSASAHRQVGYVPQHHSVGGSIPVTVREVVTSGVATQIAPWRRINVAARTRIDEAIARVGLAHRARDRVADLSGGQQRRVLIARALATSPELLVLDEPTAGVDVANQQALATTLESLIADGITVVLITHELGPVEQLATRAVVIHEGRIVFDGPPAGVGPAAEDEGGDWHHPHGHQPISVAGIGPFG